MAQRPQMISPASVPDVGGAVKASNVADQTNSVYGGRGSLAPSIMAGIGQVASGIQAGMKQRASRPTGDSPMPSVLGSESA